MYVCMYVYTNMSLYFSHDHYKEDEGDDEVPAGSGEASASALDDMMAIEVSNTIYIHTYIHTYLMYIHISYVHTYMHTNTSHIQL